MSLHHNPRIVTNGLVFAWNGLDPSSWDGTNSTHYDLVSRNPGTKTGASAITKTNEHVFFTGGGTRTAYVSFPSANITVPTGNEGTWMWASYFIDGGSIDHPNIGKETGGGWDGENGFVFGTGWGTDGPRWGIGGTNYNIYASETLSDADYRTGVWQIYTVTYTRNSSTGLQTYLSDSNGTRLCDQRTTPDSAIGSNSNALHIGATNSRGGNWNGYMDFVYMWDRALTASEVEQNYLAQKSRFGL